MWSPLRIRAIGMMVMLRGVHALVAPRQLQDCAPIATICTADEQCCSELCSDTGFGPS